MPFFSNKSLYNLPQSIYVISTVLSGVSEFPTYHFFVFYVVVGVLVEDEFAVGHGVNFLKVNCPDSVWIFWNLM
jgi:hypothetical protein